MKKFVLLTKDDCELAGEMLINLIGWLLGHLGSFEKSSCTFSKIFGLPLTRVLGLFCDFEVEASTSSMMSLRSVTLDLFLDLERSLVVDTLG